MFTIEPGTRAAGETKPDCLPPGSRRKACDPIVNFVQGVSAAIYTESGMAGPFHSASPLQIYACDAPSTHGFQSPVDSGQMFLFVVRLASRLWKSIVAILGNIREDVRYLKIGLAPWQVQKEKRSP